MFIGGRQPQVSMATAKTGSFYLTETVIIPADSADGTVVQGEIDLGAYVNVATSQALAIEQVDFVFQSGSTFSPFFQAMTSADSAFSVQLSDLNPGTKNLRADNQSLVASGGLNIDRTANSGYLTSDLYPDNFGGTALSEAFMVVNDSLYLTAGVFGAISGAADVSVTARIKCRVAKLGNKDWMAIAIQSTASDN